MSMRQRSKAARRSSKAVLVCCTSSRSCVRGSVRHSFLPRANTRASKVCTNRSRNIDRPREADRGAKLFLILFDARCFFLPAFVKCEAIRPGDLHAEDKG